MSETFPPGMRTLSPEQWHYLDGVCKEFEDAWKNASPSGERPRIQDYLPDTSDPVLGPLLRELVNLELAYRSQIGEKADLQDYLNLFPEFAELIAASQRQVDSFDIQSPKSEVGSGSSSKTPSGAARYQPLRFHKKGGLGEVHIALDAELKREVALKRIQERFAGSLDFRRRFLNEAEITGRLEHPGIVPVYGLVQDQDGQPCYAMRFIQGDSLQDAIDAFHQADLPRRDPGERRLALQQLLNHFVAVCNTIAYAHSRGIVHRDLKPSNIMLGKYGETLVVDWGLANPFARTDKERATGEISLVLTPDADFADTVVDRILRSRTGKAMGTPAYMSPEQAQGRWDNVGPRSDIYSLGATLYCLLTGKAPFGEKDIQISQGKVHRPASPRAPRQENPRVPAALAAICLKAMAFAIEERYETPLDLAAELEHWLADEPVAAHAEPWPGRLRRWVRHHKAFVVTAAATGVVFLTVTIAAALWTGERRRADEQQTVAEKMDSLRGEAVEGWTEADYQRGRAEEQESIVRRLLYFSRMNIAHRAWDSGQIASMQELLEGQRPEKTGKEDLRGFEWYYLQRLSNADLWTLEGPRGVSSLAFKPDGQRLASGHYDGTVRLWYTLTGMSHTLKGHTGAVTSVAFSSDGQRLASASEDKTVKIWDTRTEEESLTLKGHTDAVTSVAFSSDGQRLASASKDKTVKIWDTRTAKESLTFRGHSAGVMSVAFSAEAYRLASASEDITVKIWDARTGQESLTLKGHTDTVTSVAFSPNGQLLASASRDNTVRVCDACTGRRSFLLKGHTSAAHRAPFSTSVAFSPDSHFLAWASDDNTVKILDVRTGQESPFRGHTETVTSVAFSPDGHRLASGSELGTVKIWDARTGQDSFVLKGHIDGVLSVAFSRGGQLVASASRDNTVKIWDARTGHENLTLGDANWINWIGSVAFSPNGQRLASASSDGTVKVWDAHTGQKTITLGGAKDLIQSVAFSPDGQLLAWAGDDNTVKIWDARTGKESLTFRGHTARVTSVAFSPEGHRLASASLDGTVKVCDAHTGQEGLSLKGHAGAVESVAFSPDGERLASAGYDKTVKVWEALTGQESLTLRGHTLHVTTVAFSPDGRRLASGSYDKTVKIWDARTGQESLTLNGHTSALTSVAFSPDGQRLASASLDSTVRIWDARPLTSQSRLERHGLSTFRFAAQTLVLKDEVVERIRGDLTIIEPVRQQALAWADGYRESSYQLYAASWAVVSRTDETRAAYSLALRQAEAACKLESKNGNYLQTLGMAQYRAAKYGEAVETLKQSDKINTAWFQGSIPDDLAFLAMAQHKLGQKEEAAATLAHLREAMKKWPSDYNPFLEEAETLILGKK